MGEKLCSSCEKPVIDKQPPCPLWCMSPKCKAYQNKPLIDVTMKPIIWILGGPGSGKSTQCKKIDQKYGFLHLSIGDLLRAEVKRGSDRSKCLETVMARGGLVPNDIILNLIKDAIRRLALAARGFLVDGYPREKEQGIAFEKTIASVSAILYLEVSSETLMKRLTEGATGATRFDDTSEAFKLRIHTFMENKQEIFEQYAGKIYRIDGEKSIEEVFGEIQKVLDPIAAATQAAIPPASALSASPAPTMNVEDKPN